MKPNYFEARDQLMKYRVRILLKKKKPNRKNECEMARELYFSVAVCVVQQLAICYYVIMLLMDDHFVISAQRLAVS